MSTTVVEKQLREHLGRLPIEQQRQVLEFSRALVKVKVHGVPGKDLLRFAGTIVKGLKGFALDS